MENEKKKSKVLPILLVLIGLALLGTGGVLYFKDNGNEGSNAPSGEERLLEDVTLGPYVGIGEDYTFSVVKDGITYDLKYNEKGKLLLTRLGDYADYIKVNVYYVESNGEKTITKYEIYDKATNEKLEEVNSLDEFLPLIGLYATGTYTEEFTLKDLSSPGLRMGSDGATYRYYEHIFINAKGIDLPLIYIFNDYDSYDESLFVVGSTYTITFEATEGTFGYDYIIKDISKN